MSQENKIEAEKLSPTTDFLPSGGASCSPSSTPETDRIATADDWVQAGHARVLERERDAARKILEDIDEIMHLMRPRFHQTPSMCGSYPCWIVWLPKEGTCERKTLKEAIIECAAQIIPENDKTQQPAPTNDDGI